MTPDQFRQYGKQVVDWIADYYERIESLPVLSKVAPGEVRTPTTSRTAGPWGIVRPAPAGYGRGYPAGSHPLAVA